MLQMFLELQPKIKNCLPCPALPCPALSVTVALPCPALSVTVALPLPCPVCQLDKQTDRQTL
jgi:hypothetical protein